MDDSCGYCLERAGKSLAGTGNFYLQMAFSGAGSALQQMVGASRLPADGRMRILSLRQAAASVWSIPEVLPVPQEGSQRRVVLAAWNFGAFRRW